MTKLDKPLRREVDINGQPHTLTIDPAGLKLTGKGRRNGIELSWKEVANGDAPTTATLGTSHQN